MDSSTAVFDGGIAFLKLLVIQYIQNLKKYKTELTYSYMGM